MNNDILLGFLVALPIYALVLLIFKDIVIRSFIKNLIVSSKAEVVGPQTDHLFGTDEFRDAVESDLLTSYKLLLVIKDQLTFLEKTSTNNTKAEELLSNMYTEKLEELEYTLENTEHIFDDMGNTTYKEIKRNVKELLKTKNLF